MVPTEGVPLARAPRPPMMVSNRKPRLGPRPLGLHLTVALTSLLSSWSGLSLVKGGWRPLKPALRDRVTAFAADLDSVDFDALSGAVDRESRRRLDALLTGIERYRSHPYHRDLPDPAVIWAEGNSRLLDYGGSGGQSGRPVFFVPSLVNRYYILDLSRRRSLIRWLAGQGLRPLVLDWGGVGPLERRFTLTDYVAGRLDRALAAAVGATGQALPVVGYCMGGLLAAALARHRPRDVSALVLLATPWNFHAENAGTARLSGSVFATMMPAIERWGDLPVDMIQALFAQLDPWLVARKFAQFSRLDPASPEAEAFVALEDWLNDGVPLAADVARQCLIGWYRDNEPAVGSWLVAGLPMDPSAIRVPTLAVIPARDRIVPPASALALATAIPGAEILRPPLGHIGMVVAGNAETHMWQPLARWLLRN